MLQLVKKKISSSSSSAKIVYKGDAKSLFKKERLEQFWDQMEEISDKNKKSEAYIVWNCIKNGKKVVMEKKKWRINVYMKKEVFDSEPDAIITDNPELFALLEQLVQS